MNGVFAEQLTDDTFIVQVGQVAFYGKGKWQQIPLPERKEIARKLMADNLALLCSMGVGNGLHKS